MRLELGQDVHLGVGMLEVGWICVHSIFEFSL